MKKLAHSITRRSAILGGAGAFALGSSAGKVDAVSAKPNILFILADDLGYADVSCYGRPDYKTPNVDCIASQGIRFTQAYANSAVCSATRTALITGRYQDRLDVGLDEPNGARPDAGLPPSHPTIPSLLKKVGYSTTLVGKWHLGNLPKFGPRQSGYDHFIGVRSGGADYFNYDKDFWNEDSLAHETGYLTDRLGDHAVSMIETLASAPDPFFISLHFTAPHWPWEGPKDQAESQRLANKPGGIFTFDSGSQKTFEQMVVALDAQIGRALDALERTGCVSNTIVVFTSDNGGERFSDTWPFNGKKGELLEGGIRVPAIVRWTGRIEPNTTSDQVIMSMDWMPTFLAVAGTAPDQNYPPDDINLLKTLEGKDPIKPRKIFWRYNSLHQEAVRDGDWKYLQILDNSFLFNVVDDPLERANLKDRYPNIFKRLASDWQAWNSTMLHYTEANYSWTGSGKELADHFGAPEGIVPKRPNVKPGTP